MPTTCGCCGTPLGPDDLAWDYPLPDSFAGMPDEDIGRILRFHSHAMLIAEGFGTAIRVILPIALDTGHTATLGVWMALSESAAEAQRVVDAARAGGSAWIGCTFRGVLLNAVAPWSEVGFTRITARAFEEGVLARVVDAEDTTLKRVLTEAWPHAEVVGARAGR